MVALWLARFKYLNAKVLKFSIPSEKSVLFHNIMKNVHEQVGILSCSLRRYFLYSSVTELRVYRCFMLV